MTTKTTEKPDRWKEEAHRIVLGFHKASMAGEGSRVQFIEELGDRGTDLAVLEEVLSLATVGLAFLGLEKR